MALSCGSHGEPPAIYGDAPAMEDYRSVLGELDPLTQEGSLFFPDSVAPTEAEYRHLSSRYRENGLEGLSPEERQSLLVIAQLAFLAYVDTIRYSVSAADSAAGRSAAHEGRAVLQEVYQHGELPFLTMRRVEGKAIDWPWASDPVWDPGAATEALLFVEGSPESSDFVPVTVWERRAGQWTCATGRTSSVDMYGGIFVHFRRARDWASGEAPARVGDVAGRPAYEFQMRGRTWWLDSETLWLRQYEYEEDGVHYLVKLEAINEDIRIEPPDVDVECIEEEIGE
jgi:hypothetical protein